MAKNKMSQPIRLNLIWLQFCVATIIRRWLDHIKYTGLCTESRKSAAGQISCAFSFFLSHRPWFMWTRCDAPSCEETPPWEFVFVDVFRRLFASPVVSWHRYYLDKEKRRLKGNKTERRETIVRWLISFWETGFTACKILIRWSGKKLFKIVSCRKVFLVELLNYYNC